FGKGILVEDSCFCDLGDDGEADVAVEHGVFLDGEGTTILRRFALNFGSNDLPVTQTAAADQCPMILLRCRIWSSSFMLCTQVWNPSHGDRGSCKRRSTAFVVYVVLEWLVHACLGWAQCVAAAKQRDGGQKNNHQEALFANRHFGHEVRLKKMGP
ncbi:hypothetical protein VWR49_22675, partial [Xanthomonas citri pv. citri]